MCEIPAYLLQQMMGPEAMGIQPLNLDWWNEKVCRNFLFGTCLHTLFGNTVSYNGLYQNCVGLIKNVIENGSWTMPQGSF